MSVNEPYGRAESGITCLLGWKIASASFSERLNEEDTRIDCDAQPTATLDIKPPHLLRREGNQCCLCPPVFKMEQKEDIVVGFPFH